MKSSPAFQWYPADWFGSQRVQLLTLEEEGAYIRLIGSCWQHGSIPADPEKIARLIGKGASTTLATTLATMFQPHPSDPTKLVHDRLETERAKQDEWRIKSSKGGKNSAKSRIYSKGGSTTLATISQPPLQPNGNQTSTLLSSTSIEVEVQKKQKVEKSKASSADECESFALSIGASPGQGEAWFFKMEGCGWLNGNKPVKNWKATLTAWHKQGYLPVVVNTTTRKKGPLDAKAAEEIPVSMPLSPEPGSAGAKLISGLRKQSPPDPCEIIYIEQERD